MMKIKKLVLLIMLSGIICLISCANKNSSSHFVPKESIGEYFEDFFYLGAAINEDIILGLDPKSKKIVKSQFNTITPENSLKWMFIQPEPNKFNFDISIFTLSEI